MRWGLQPDPGGQAEEHSRSPVRGFLPCCPQEPAPYCCPDLLGCSPSWPLCELEALKLFPRLRAGVPHLGGARRLDLSVVAPPILRSSRAVL